MGVDTQQSPTKLRLKYLPSPTKAKVYMCGGPECNKPCRNNQLCIMCDTCSTWWHGKCAGVQVRNFPKSRQWFCSTCDSGGGSVRSSPARPPVTSSPPPPPITDRVPDPMKGSDQVNEFVQKMRRETKGAAPPPVILEEAPEHSFALPNPSGGQSEPHTQGDLAAKDFPVYLHFLPPFHVVHRTHIPTITHIPKGARADWTRLFTSVVSKVASNPDNLANHILLSMVARVIRPASQAPPQPTGPSQAAKVKERIRRWRAGDFLSLWDEAVLLKQPPTRGRRRQPQEEVSLKVKNARRRSNQGGTVHQGSPGPDVC